MININGEEWYIRLVPKNHFSLYRSDGTLSLAACDDSVKTIFISDSITDKNIFKKVLCHELTHATMFSFNVELTIEQEELLADLLATYGEGIVNTTNEMGELLI